MLNRGNELVGELRKIIGSVVRTEVVIEPTTMAADILRWDSHATVEIIFAIEDHFGFEMTSEEMEAVIGVQSLIDIISRRRLLSAA